MVARVYVRLIAGLVVFCGLAFADQLPILYLGVGNDGAEQYVVVDISDVSGAAACAAATDPSTVCTDLSLTSGSIDVTFSDTSTASASLSTSLPLSGIQVPPEFFFPLNPDITDISFTGTISATTLTLLDGSTVNVSPTISGSASYDSGSGIVDGLVYATTVTSTVPEPNSVALLIALFGVLLISIRSAEVRRERN